MEMESLFPSISVKPVFLFLFSVSGPRVAVSALVDTGASCSFVSAQFAAMTRLHVDQDMPMVVQLPTGRSETMDCVLHYILLIEI